MPLYCAWIKTYFQMRLFKQFLAILSLLVCQSIAVHWWRYRRLIDDYIISSWIFQGAPIAQVRAICSIRRGLGTEKTQALAFFLLFGWQCFHNGSILHRFLSLLWTYSCYKYLSWDLSAYLLPDVFLHWSACSAILSKMISEGMRPTVRACAQGIALSYGLWGWMHLSRLLRKPASLGDGDIKLIGILTLKFGLPTMLKSLCWAYLAAGCSLILRRCEMVAFSPYLMLAAYGSHECAQASWFQ